MSPADQLYRWHALYQATGARNCVVHPTEVFLEKYGGAMVHFAAKNKQLLVTAAHAYVHSWKQPFSWDDVTASLAPETAFRRTGKELKELFGFISVSTVDKLKAFVIDAAELFGDVKWSYMSTLHIVFVRVMLTRATAIPLAERKIMAGLALGMWHTHVTLFMAPGLSLDNSQQRLKCLY